MSCVYSKCSKRIKKNQRDLSGTICKNYIHKCCSDLSCKELKSRNFANIGTVNHVLRKLAYLLTTLKVIIGFSWNCIECLKTNCTAMNL